MNRYAVWFSRVVWIGLVANCLLALPTLLMPGPVMTMFALPQAWPLMWPSFAALLLLLLSAFYVPAALHPLRYLPVSWLAVVARLAGVIFFCGFNRDYNQLGLFDLTFLLPEASLLALAVRERKRHPLEETTFVRFAPHARRAIGRGGVDGGVHRSCGLRTVLP